MADEPEVVQPVVETPAADPAPAVEQPVAAEPEAPAEPVVEPEPKPKKTPWYMERIAEETRKRGEAERRATALEAALTQAVKSRTDAPAQSETPAPVAAEPEQPKTQDEIEKAAARLVADREFNAKCNAAYDAGTKEYKDFGEAVENLRALGALDPSFVESVVATDAPPKVLHYLGTHPEEAQRILALPLRRQVIELDRIANATPAAKPISKTEAPVKPLGGSARISGELRDDEPMDSWYAKRMKQREARMH